MVDSFDPWTIDILLVNVNSTEISPYGHDEHEKDVDVEYFLVLAMQPDRIEGIKIAVATR